MCAGAMAMVAVWATNRSGAPIRHSPAVGNSSIRGVHLIDLARWFLGDFVDIRGIAHTYYWPMPVEDNDFLLLKTARDRWPCCMPAGPNGRTSFPSKSLVARANWTFTGLGGSYGVERLAYYRMLPEMGPPETTIWEYPRTDTSWAVEFAEFVEDLQPGRSTCSRVATDAHAASYRSSSASMRGQADDHHP